MGHLCCAKQKVKRGLWSPEEDEKLIDHITKHGHSCWSTRCGKSCRLRWINYLKPDLKRGSFSAEEERIIIDVHRILGNRWAQIAKHLPGRTDNEVKNFWNSCIKKKLMAQGLDPKTHNLLSSSRSVTTMNNNSDELSRFGYGQSVHPAPFTISPPIKSFDKMKHTGTVDHCGFNSVVPNLETIWPPLIANSNALPSHDQSAEGAIPVPNFQWQQDNMISDHQLLMGFKDQMIDNNSQGSFDFTANGGSSSSSLDYTNVSSSCFGHQQASGFICLDENIWHEEGAMGALNLKQGLQQGQAHQAEASYATTLDLDMIESAFLAAEAEFCSGTTSMENLQWDC
ncbi:hypothetical protein ZIOFF_047355 [Zingiber officinale]|uniref:Uncharacterized protein n=1 Tax=Zingiber officinale TaxID=94328 RepID=A0A8J5KPX3_ZINOF|nr:hypothetical protein ZIOFF_047355 [Zingiber officinale]